MDAGLGFEPRMAKAYETLLVTGPFPRKLMVGVQRFELWTPASQTQCANQTALHSDLTGTW